MFRRRSRFFFLFSVFFSVLLPGCGFVDFRPIVVSTVPETPWAILPGEETPALIHFDTSMEKPSVEKAVRIFSFAGVAEGEFKWEGNDLLFFPSVPWQPGLRYSLRLSGTVFAIDGRELLLAKEIPFYAISRSSLPYIKSFFPDNGMSVGTGGTFIMEIIFSLPMDRQSTEEALKLDIPGEIIYSWFDDDTTLRIGSDEPLNPWTVYRWSVSEKAKNREGAPLAKEFSGSFVTDMKKDFLKVVRIIPLAPALSSGYPAEDSVLWGSWEPLETSLEPGLGSGQGIGVEFNKPPDGDSLRRAFSFTPPLPGRVELLSPVSAVFIPSKDPDPETVYSLLISGSLKDSEGLKMGDDYIASFTSDIHYLKVFSVGTGEDGGLAASDSGGIFPVHINSGGAVRCYIHFSLPFDSEKTALLEETAFKISLSPFFPETLPFISLRSAIWLSVDTLLLEWEGLKPGDPDEAHYYKLVIPGGSGVTHNGAGSFLKDDFYLYLEAKNE